MGRRLNGEGSIYETIKRNKRATFLDRECDICKNCTDRSECNNRIGYDKCIKCKECKECLHYCDRFYCYKVVNAQLKHQSIATASSKREVLQKKDEKIKKISIDKRIKNKELTLVEVMQHNEDEKLKYNLINENSYLRNCNTINAIQRHPASSKIMSQLTETDIKDILAYFVDIGSSQSNLDKAYDEIRVACDKSNLKELFDDIARHTFISNATRKQVEAFSSAEENALINYINCNEDKLIVNCRCNIGPKTIKNLIKFALATGMRIGELCALNMETDIDLENKRIIVSKTLTRDKGGNIIIGKQTKTGRKDKQKGKNNTRSIPFGILFPEDDVVEILDEQINVSKHIPGNTHNLLFCALDGKEISHSSFNAIFKRICIDVGIKSHLPKGCNTHMTKHTAVSRMIENGVDIYAISALVGTSVEVLHKTYAHIFDDFIEKEIQKSRERNKISLNAVSTYNNVLPFKTYAAK